MKESKLVKGVVATVAVIAFSVPAIASADAGSELQGTSVKVSYADLNLEKEAGAKTLYRRLQLASKQACGVSSNQAVGSIKQKTYTDRCYQSALDEAVAKIDNDTLTSIHES